MWVSGGCLIDGLDVGPGGMFHINNTGGIVVHVGEQAKQEMDRFSIQEGADKAIQEWFGILYNASSEWYGSETFDQEPLNVTAPLGLARKYRSWRYV